MKMTIDEALDRISRAKTSLPLKEKRDTVTLTLMLGLLRKLRNAPGPPEVIQGKLLSLAKRVDLLVNKEETDARADTIKGSLLVESRSLKQLTCHASDGPES